MTQFMPSNPPRLLTLLIAAVVIPITLSLGVIGYLGIDWLERQTEQRMREDIELISRSLKEPLNQAIRTNQPELIQQSLNSAFAFGRIYGAHIYGRNGELLAGSGAGVRRFSEQRGEALATLDADGDGYATLGSEPVHVYFMPLTTAGGRFAGLLQLTRHPDEFRDTLSSIRITGAAMLGGIALWLGLIVMLGHRIAIGGPLRRLERSMQSAAEQELGYRVSGGGPREIANLTHGINKMLSQIESSRKLAAVGELSAGIAHQLGTPLSVLDGRAQQLLRQPDLNHQQRSNLEAVRAETRRIAEIVQRLMAFSRSMPLQPTLTKLSTVVTHSIERMAHAPEAEDVVLVQRLNKDDPPIMIDAERLEEAICNLMLNAFQAAPFGKVCITSAITDQSVTLRIEDDGPGIAKEDEGKIFSPFFTRKPVGIGTGLGLAVAYGTVRAHGGQIRLAQGELPGACFELSLPVRAQEVSQ